MSTYTQILYQIVFSTRNRKPTLISGGRKDLFRCTWGILKNKKCHMYRINGVDDHIHIVTHLHPSISLADLIKDIKLSTTDYIKKNRIFPFFNGWQDGYGAFTYSIDKKDYLIEYVKNQEEHHKKKTFKEEFMDLLKANKIDYNQKYLL